MRRKATESMIILVALLALGLSACKSDPIPPPPPPPPPPPEPTAEVSITTVVDVDTGEEVDATDCAEIADGCEAEGRIAIVVDFDAGDTGAQSLDLQVNDEAISCGSLPTGLVGLRGDVVTVQCVIDTAEGIGPCQGQPLNARFANGSYTIDAELTLTDGSSVASDNSVALTFSNEMTSGLVAMDIGPRVVSIERTDTEITVGPNPGSMTTIDDYPQAGADAGSDGVPYWGGPRDLTWAVCPVVFDLDLADICTIELAAAPTDPGDNILDSSNGALDFGSGPGVRHASNAPFMYTAARADNEDRIEDSADNPLGQVIGSDFRVILCDGTNVTQFFGIVPDVRHLDTTAPICAERRFGDPDFGDLDECAPYIDNMDVFDPTDPNLYSGGIVHVHQVDEDGVGAEHYVDVLLDAANCTDGADAGELECDADASDVLVSNVMDIDDLDEDDGCTDGTTTSNSNVTGAPPGCSGAADKGGVDAYFIVLGSVCDRLDNCLEDGGPEGRAAIADQFRNTIELGVDRTAPNTNSASGATTFQPRFSPDPYPWRTDSDGDLLVDETFMFGAVDPILASGDAGSQVENAGCDVSCGDQDFDTDDIDVNFEEPDGTDHFLDCNEVDGGGTPTLGTGMFSCSVAGLADGSYSVTTQIADRARKFANVTTVTQNIDIDNGVPVFGALNPAPTGSPGTDAGAIVMTIGGTVDDASVIASAVINVRVDGTDAAGTGSNGTCEATDYLLDDSSAAGEIDRNGIDVADGTDSVSFNESFTVTSPGAGTGAVNYCFEIVATDVARSKTNALNGNSDTLFTLVVVVWN